MAASLYQTGFIRFFECLTRRRALLGSVASLAALGGRRGAAQVATPPAAAHGDVAGLVGHSLGGQIVRLFASTYPDEVVGLVLVDALPEGLWEGIQAAVTPAQ